jgi:MYXO-CTERM domain-containing protein
VDDADDGNEGGGSPGAGVSRSGGCSVGSSSSPRPAGPMMAAVAAFALVLARRRREV